MSTKILVVNDLHVGSTVGLMPDVVKTPEKNDIVCNDIQAYMYEQWIKMCERDEYDVCICNGDLCEGINPAEDGKGLWTVDKQLQVNTAAALLSMVDAKFYHGTAGSQYHTGKKYNLDEMVMDSIGGTFDDDCILVYDGVRFHVRHDTGFTSTPYTRSNSLNKDMVNTVLEKEEYGHIDVFLRAHTHYGHFVGWKNRLGLINPCWKYKDGFPRRRNNIGCDLGYSVFEVDDGEYMFKTHTFKLPGYLVKGTMEYGSECTEGWCEETEGCEQA